MIVQFTPAKTGANLKYHIRIKNNSFPVVRAIVCLINSCVATLIYHIVFLCLKRIKDIKFPTERTDKCL
jgi:ABC-type polysaccharide/polyol phosphate export permease